MKLLLEMLSYPFIVRALAVGLMVSLCASLLGVSMVMRRMSMIGDGLAHVGFGAMAVAAALGAAPLLVTVPVTVGACFLLTRVGRGRLVKGDAAVAVLSTGALAIGVMVVAITTGITTEVCNYMFGSIFAMSRFDATLSIAISILALIIYFLFYHPVFALSFDEEFSLACGGRTGRDSAVLALLTAVAVALGIRMMGALQISSLVIFPALTSMRLCGSYRAAVLCSAVVSALCFLGGMAASYALATPAGASVVCANMLCWLLFTALAALRRGVKG